MPAMKAPATVRRPNAISPEESPTYRAELCLFVLLVAVLGSLILATFGTPGRILKATTVLLQKRAWTASIS